MWILVSSVKWGIFICDRYFEEYKYSTVPYEEYNITIVLYYKYN